MTNPHYYLTEALKLAAIRHGFCAPNPAVGVVIAKENRVLATGYHWASGHPHAEIAALNQLTSEDSQGATLYSTLEPCCHWGKTPPCVEQIIASGIKEVFYSYPDPNPQVSGKGQEKLLQAGVNCTQIELPAISAFYQSYYHWWQTGRPSITAKIALSLDGKIAGPQGKTVAITTDAVNEYTHQQRKYHDAILTTAVTVNRDNPQLNVRLKNENYAKPIFILDSRLSLFPTAKIFTTAQRIVIFHQFGVEDFRIQHLKKLNVECIAVEHDAYGLNLKEILAYIGTQGIHDLWIEAGGKCFQAFLREKLINRALIYVGAKWLGKTAQSAFTDDFNVFANSKNVRWQNFNNDAMCEILF